MISESSPEVMRGHFEECLAHYRDRLNEQMPKGAKGVAKLKRPLAEFCGVRIDAVQFWLRPIPVPPKAPVLFKLWCFLDLIGYRVIELERLPVSRRNFLELIGYGLITETEAVSLLHYSSTSTLYSVLTRNSGSTEERDQRMWEICKERRGSLEERKAEAARMYLIPSTPDLKNPEKPKAVEKSKIPEKPEEIGRVTSTAGQVLAVFSIVDGLLRLFESGLLENIPSEVAFSVRNDVNKIFRLTSHLTNLGAKVTSAKQ